MYYYVLVKRNNEFLGFAYYPGSPITHFTVSKTHLDIFDTMEKAIKAGEETVCIRQNTKIAKERDYIFTFEVKTLENT